MLKPTITKRKDVRGRRIVGYDATIGPITAHALTAADAVDQCERAVLARLDQVQTGTTIGIWNGHTYAIMPDRYSSAWAYWVDTFSRPDYTVSGGDREGAIASAIISLAQHDWTPDADDRVFLQTVPDPQRAELTTWISFQRAYIRERAAGTPELECHRRACENPEPVNV